MTPRRQARLAAAAALLELGWAPERIALAFDMSRASVERLIPAPPPPEPTPVWLSRGTCHHLDRLGYYCDLPIVAHGELYCDQHRRPVWPS